MNTRYQNENDKNKLIIKTTIKKYNKNDKTDKKNTCICHFWSIKQFGVVTTLPLPP